MKSNSSRNRPAGKDTNRSKSKEPYGAKKSGAGNSSGGNYRKSEGKNSSKEGKLKTGERDFFSFPGKEEKRPRTGSSISGKDSAKPAFKSSATKAGGKGEREFDRNNAKGRFGKRDSEGGSASYAKGDQPKRQGNDSREDSAFRSVDARGKSKSFVNKKDDQVAGAAKSKRFSKQQDEFSFSDDFGFSSERRSGRGDQDDWNFGKDEFAEKPKSERGKKIEIQKALNKGINSSDFGTDAKRKSPNDLSNGLKSFGKFYVAPPEEKPKRAPRKSTESDDSGPRPMKPWEKRYAGSGKSKATPHQKKNDTLPDIKNDEIRLNRYLSLAGICSRRDADEFIKAGAVTVNGKVVVEMGYKVQPGDEVVYGGLGIRPEKPVYLLLNKPKDYITTSDDPQNRKTVLHLIQGACKERVYPVGRLDRNTTGLLLFTNDGEMAKKLTHPSSKVQKMYHVVLDKPLTAADKVKIASGITLEDGPVIIDEINYVDTAGSKKEVGVVIHSGRNRIVRRIFESLDYEVVKLDRVMFAGLTKKDLPKGKWRMLSKPELNLLKML
jgi:23S rRNA pseudouridine2605 synthase